MHFLNLGVNKLEQVFLFPVWKTTGVRDWFSVEELSEIATPFSERGYVGRLFRINACPVTVQECQSFFQFQSICKVYANLIQQ